MQCGNARTAFAHIRRGFYPTLKPAARTQHCTELLRQLTVLCPRMRCERRPGPEFLEQLLLPLVNIVFLMIPVLLVIIELTSLAALQASTPDLPQAAQAPVIAPARRSQPSHPNQDSEPPAPESAPLFADPMVGYGP